MSGPCCNHGLLQTILPTAILATGFLGSWHCLGMCGGLVLSACKTTVDTIGYQCGRLLGYCILGAIAGLLGGWISPNTSTTLSWVGALIISGLLIYNGVSLIRQKLHPFPALPLARFFPTSRRYPSSLYAFTIGGMSALLPCGFLYSIVLSLTLTHRPLFNILAMAAFWLGTLPILAIGPGMLRLFLKQYAKGVPVLMGALMILAGLVAIYLKF